MIRYQWLWSRINRGDFIVVGRDKVNVKDVVDDVLPREEGVWSY